MHAQDFRALITGQVTDPSGAAVPNATVTAGKLDSGVSRTTQTNPAGAYSLPYLLPGVYTLSVEAHGFKKALQENITLAVAEKRTLDFRLELGAVSQEITVTASAAVVESASADRGLVFDPIKTQELPLNGRQTYMLLALTPGVIFTQEVFGPTGFSGTRGWDVNNSYKINGARTGQNVFLLNGAPISDNNGTWQLAPNIEAVQEFKVMTNTYDAQYGRFGGGVVNTTVKSGTNQWHGDVFDYFRNRFTDANSFQNNVIGAPKPKHNQHQFGGVAGGPVRKDRDFVLGSFEGWTERIGFPVVSDVPPDPLRVVRADGVHFGTDAGLTDANGNPVAFKIYDPTTTHLCGARPTETPAVCRSLNSTFVRDRFSNDVIPLNRISPVGQKILSYFPTQNAPGLSGNFVAAGNVARYWYYQPMGRWDHVFNDNNRLYTLFTFQHGTEYRDSTGFGPPAGSGDVGSERTDVNFVLDWTHVISPSTVLDVRGSFGRLTQYFPRYTDFNLTADTLGMTQMIHAPTVAKNTVPLIDLGGYQTLFALRGANNIFTWDTYGQWDFAPSLTMTRGRHTVHTGFELDYAQRGNTGLGWSNGRLNFDQVWTRQLTDRGQGTFDGSTVAGLLLGTPQSGNIDSNDSGYRTRPYYAFYAQDDWRLRPHLMLNLGLRYDVQVPWVERFDRVTRGFDVSTKSPLSDQILTKWAAFQADWTACAGGNTSKCSSGVTPAFAGSNPYPAPPSALTGGYLFPGVGGQPRRQYDTDWTSIAPRLGVAWRLSEKTVLRAGGGVYYQSPTQTGVVAGFNQSTPYNRSLDGITPSAGLTGPYSLVNPFPTGLAAASGSSLGLLTNVGNGVSFDPPHFKIPRTYQYSFGIQRELPHGILAEVSYASNYQIYINGGFNQNHIILADNNRAFVDPNFKNYLNTQVPNPFFGILPATSGQGQNQNISVQSLIRPDPVFGDITNNLIQAGHYRSDALQVKVEKRVGSGSGTAGALTWVLSYTIAKAFEQNHRLNDWNSQEPFIYELDNTDKPQTLAFSGVWDLPLGQNRRFDVNNSVARAILGNWRFDWIFTYNSGYPVGWPNLINNCGNWHATVQDENHWFNSDKTCYQSFPSFNVRTIPDRFGDIRNPADPQMNAAVERTIPIKERYRLQFRAETFNLTNTPIRPGPPTDFNSSQFGQLPKSQNNFPRVIQFAAKVYF